MATTAIGTDRQQGSAMEKYPDAVFMRDGKNLYFGNDGDASINFDGSTVVLGGTWVIGGEAFTLSDTTTLAFGNDSDATIAWDGTTMVLGGTWILGGSDLVISDTTNLSFGDTANVTLTWNGSALIITGLPTSNPSVTGGLYLANNSDVTMSTS